MITESQQEQASLFALGTLASDEEQTFVAELRDNAELRNLVRSLQSAASFLTRSKPLLPLPAGLKDKVFRRIDAAESSRKTPSPASLSQSLAGLNFIKAIEQTAWKPLPIPGASVMLLSLERERGYAVLLGKLAPGARYPAHRNAGPEDFYILTGDLVVGDRTLAAGDFHHADGGSQHEENHSVNGCTLLAVLTTDDPLVALALA
jgi:anti-sigma factor ChrR (cupin superfamily)